MCIRRSLQALTVALLLGSVGCGDDDDDDDAGVDDAGASGQGGRGGSSSAGSGGRPPIDCTPSHAELEDWCDLEHTECELSEQEQLDALCGSSVHIGRGSNSCGGSSITAAYGVDVKYVAYHYDADGELVGVLVIDNWCSGGGPRTTYGEECDLSGQVGYDCTTDGDAGL